MVFVFRTNVTDVVHADALVKSLTTTFPSAVINFDLEDCDNILRIACRDLSVHTILKVTQTCGIWCEELNDLD